MGTLAIATYKSLLLSKGASTCETLQVFIYLFIAQKAPNNHLLFFKAYCGVINLCRVSWSPGGISLITSITFTGPVKLLGP